MNTNLESPFSSELRHGLSSIRGNWFWLVLVGVALVVLGMAAIGYVAIASVAVAVAIGYMILLSGVAELIGAFWSRLWSGFSLHLLSGVLAIVIGVLILKAPVNTLVVITLLVAAMLLVSGIFKIAAALSHRFASWGWPLMSGVIDVVLGIMIMQDWPASALWVVGLFLGINMLFRGINWIMLGLAIRSLPNRPLA